MLAFFAVLVVVIAIKFCDTNLFSHVYIITQKPRLFQDCDLGFTAGKVYVKMVVKRRSNKNARRKKESTEKH